MAAPKKKTSKVRRAGPPPDAAHQFTVVLEEIRAQNRAFGEGQQLLREQMHTGFEEVNRRFEQVDRRLGRVEDAVLQHGRELKNHGELLREHGEQLRDHGEQLRDHGTQLRAIAEKKVDREEVEAIVERAIGRTGGEL